jgi:hypothetical protein
MEAFIITLFTVVINATILLRHCVFDASYFRPTLIFGGKAWSQPLEWRIISGHSWEGSSLG